jgi:hypothetical protein
MTLGIRLGSSSILALLGAAGGKADLMALSKD